jgi:hypothetical protein
MGSLAAVRSASTAELVETMAACAAELGARPAPDHPGVCFDQAETLGRAADAIEGALALRVAVADRQGEPQRWGYPSATSWLRTRLGMRHSRAQDRATLARQLDRLPQVAKRLAAEQISYGYASVIAAALRRLDDAEAGKGEQILLDLVDAGCTVKDVTAAGDRIKELIAQRDGTDPEPEDGRRGERQWWTLNRGRGGQAWSKGLFGAELAALIRAKIEPLATPAGPEDNRDHAQRMADALQTYLADGGTGWDPILIVELKQPLWRPRTNGGADQAQSDPPDKVHDPEATTGPPEKTPDVAWELRPPAPNWPNDGTAFTARLPDGTAISVGRARQILLAAGFSALVLGTDGQPLYLGRKVRCATPHQRRALNARYQTCAVTGCDIPAGRCELDHADGWANGDVTDADKLAPLCRFHNGFKYDHPGRIYVTTTGDGRYRYELIRPSQAPGNRRPGHHPTGQPPERGP